MPFIPDNYHVLYLSVIQVDKTDDKDTMKDEDEHQNLTTFPPAPLTTAAIMSPAPTSIRSKSIAATTSTKQALI